MESPIDIDEARSDDPNSLRRALLDQIAYLLDEIDALRTVVEDVPEQIKSGRPAPDALTMKELYGVIATLDAEVRQPRVERVVQEEIPFLEPVDAEEQVRDAGWNERAIDAILDEVRSERRALVDELEALSVDQWQRTATLENETVTLFELVYRMARADAERLRDLGYRLHNAHLSERDKPLPT